MQFGRAKARECTSVCFTVGLVVVSAGRDSTATITETITSATATSKTNACKLKTPPFGWDAVQTTESGKPITKFIENSSEQLVLGKIHAMNNSGKRWEDIANWLNAEKIKPRKGGMWYASTAWQIAHSKLALESKKVA